MLGKTYQGDFSPRDRKEYLQDYVHGVFEPGGEMVFPLPKGAAALTAPGDPVLAGQVLSEGGIPVHCSCSGTVKAVEVRSTARGDALCVVVENDKLFRAAEGVGVKTDWQEMPRSEILRRIDAAGALAVDEQRFPSALKLTSLGPDAVSRVVVDGTDARRALDTAVKRINRETYRKLEEFGYYRGGKMIKEFRTPTAEVVEKLIEQARQAAGKDGAEGGADK